jgi:chaperonin GroES
MKLRPLHDRVVLTRIDAEAKTAGGIIIPDTAKEKPQEGRVVAVGPGGRDEAGKLIPIDVKVGDRVLFGKWSGTEVKIDGVEFLILKEFDIIGGADGGGSKQEGRLTPPIILSPRPPKNRLHPNRTMHQPRQSFATCLSGAGEDEVERKGTLTCLPRKLDSRSMLATACCTASTRWPTRCA